jgi:chitinase
VEKHYPTDSWEPGNNVYGCIKQLYILKRQDRKMKTLLSIGGWGSDKNFSPMANNPAGRARFASMAVQFVKDLGFDGIDIDWEFPKTGVDAENFVLLLEALRSALDKYAEEYAPGYHFLMTVASPGGPREYNIWHLGAMDRYLDAWHLMTYDYSGSWNDRTGHSSNLHGSTEKPKRTPYTTEKTVTAYIEAGVSPDKIILGVPVYGHSFQATTGFGQPFNGEGEKDEAKGSWDKGVWDYKVLPKAGATEHFDEKLGASWSYDEVTKELISYDNSQVAKLKASYIKDKGLGGAFYWESSADKKGPESLIGTIAESLGKLEQSENLLSYSSSAYANMAAGMPGQ